MDKWQDIASITETIERCLLWCSDIGHGGMPIGVCMGRVYFYGPGDVNACGDGMHGRWTFTHVMPLPPAPEAAR